ncbi:hypothetical protein ColTof3_01534 [Colletotrichum tofieldiae]|nr:hypothetical protein ColTof3_01534 [Colletotrichum tofieldiae]
MWNKQDGAAGRQANNRKNGQCGRYAVNHEHPRAALKENVRSVCSYAVVGHGQRRQGDEEQEWGAGGPGRDKKEVKPNGHHSPFSNEKSGRELGPRTADGS